jgi:catechol 2,3-dioxygenase-like lactoylglutathione lyase family enzyme
MTSHQVRMEGLMLTVVDVMTSVDYCCNKLGLFKLERNAAPQFARLRVNDGAATLRLLSWAEAEAEKEGAERLSHAQARAVHIEFSTDDLDGLYADLVAKGVVIDVPPHDEPWERAMTAFDPDGYSVEMAQGRRGKKE